MLLLLHGCKVWKGFDLKIIDGSFLYLIPFPFFFIDQRYTNYLSKLLINRNQQFQLEIQFTSYFNQFIK